MGLCVMGNYRFCESPYDGLRGEGGGSGAE